MSDLELIGYAVEGVGGILLGWNLAQGWKHAVAGIVGLVCVVGGVQVVRDAQVVGRCEAVEVQEYVSPEGCTTDTDCEAREAAAEVWI